jgi:4-hydroxy-4-methyl-2-oxoglutarate aldolase
MRSSPSLTEGQLERLRRIDSDLLANAIETFDVRLRNTGFTDSTIRCLFPDTPPMVGYAATGRVRTSEPPMEGHSYVDRTDWWNHILKIPAPRVVVIEDVDEHRGLGAFAGGVHMNILAALGCVGIVTNGAVRSANAARSLPMQIFATNTTVSHAYAHVFDFGACVTVGGLHIEPGDLLHGDAYGVQTVPMEIATRIPPVAREIARTKHRIIALCRSREFSIERLRSLVREIDVQQARNLQGNNTQEGEAAP